MGTAIFPHGYARLRDVGALAAAGLLLAAATAASADDSAARLQLAALVEEAGLLLEESAGLEPIRQRIREDGERLAAAEKTLTEAVARTEQEVAAYNDAVAALTAEVAAHKQACPPTRSAVTAANCNDALIRLLQRSTELEQQHAALAERQSQINAQVEQHNGARQAWLAARREHAPKIDANAADTQRWVTAARSVMVSDAFGALRRLAGSPPACDGLRVADGTALFGQEGLERLHGCLQAVARAI